MFIILAWALNNVRSVIRPKCTRRALQQINVRCLMTIFSTRKKARQLYKADKEKNTDCIYTSDLQKVLILPVMDEYKSAIFTSRLFTYNKTFSHIGNTTEEKPNIPVVWHEATAGRSASELSSAYFRALQEMSKQNSDPVLWMDNCSSQQKKNLFLPLFSQLFMFCLWILLQLNTLFLATHS